MSRRTSLFRALVPALVLAALPSAAHAATASPSGAGCDRLDDAACLLPFPNDALRKDGKLDLRTSQMPRNAKGKAIDAAGWKGLDGFSPGSVILTKVPGWETDAALERSGAVSLSDLSKYTDKKAPVLVIDEQTGKRWPIWTELDNNAKQGYRLLEVHPAKNFLEGHTYVVVLRALKRADGSAIRAGKRFASLRDGQRPAGARYAKIFKAIKKAGVKRDKSLFLTWDFTVASEKSLSGRAVFMRDQTFKALGDTNLADGKVQGAAPAFTLQTKPLDGDLAKFAGRYAQVLEGTFPVPCYLTKGCAPGSRMTIGADGLPKQQGTYTARFTCVVPATATADHPARLALYGHGLLGKETEILSGPDVPKMAAESNTVFCATPWIGMASEDIPNAIDVLGDFSGMPTLPDRLQQGFLDALVLGRAMAHPQGLATSPLLEQGGRSIVQTGSIGYDSNSQGGIAGGALTALAPDFSHAVLGVPGMNYSVLLPRSADFDTYSLVMYPAYKDQVERPLILDLAQLLWDRGEGDGYAQHMTGDPLPNTIKHTVLLDVGLGDHQVTQFQADVEARTIGASIHTPIVAAGRSPQAKPSWGIPAIASYPFNGSAIVYWDAGPALVNVPPLANHPNRGKQDPHELVRRTPAARQQKATFLAGGGLIDPCGGKPCVAASDVG
ncbi:hypothetical protein DSM104299_00851 [Baekduia alba]|uniref:hypothetical protein n=1 Tax=Baekduia alba TaxID=2997333 RepID=UPI00234258BF|nr:hypothetical protein [Baekduia alba]WCB92163.1 hypothetical protein DSM104299_00851 [Baekduia alba]